MATSMLALPPAGGTGPGVDGRRGILPHGMSVAGVSTLMLMGGLVAAYLSVKSATKVWPPEGVEFDRYTATTLAITVLMAMVTIEWAAHAIRNAFRGQALFAFFLTTMFGIAHLTGLAFLINGFKFTAGETPYATVVYAITGVPFIIALVAVGGVVLVALRSLGHQLSTDNYALMRSAAILWHVAAIAWIIAYYTVYITK